MHAVVSVDGYIADEQDDVGPLFEWYFNGDSEIVGGQALLLGLVDEVAMDVVPVVFGSGKRYFGEVSNQHLLEDPDLVVRADRVLHLRFRVRHEEPGASSLSN